MIRMRPEYMTEPTLDGFTPLGKAIGALRLMLKIRLAEEAIVAKYPEQQMRCPVHLSIGQEAAAVGLSLPLAAYDCVVSTHRCHAHYLAKGGSLRAMMAELYGRSTGCAGGKGGSMHLVDPGVGMMGSSAILGGSTPLAVGMALGFQLRKEGRVAVAYFGDGATEQGAFHECLNLAALRKLPIVFACENNEYATLSHISARQPGDVPLRDRAAVYRIPAVNLDGTDVSAVYRAARDAVERARKGGGPSLILSRVYRWKEHVGPNNDDVPGVKTKEDLEIWKAHDPIDKWQRTLVAVGLMTDRDAELLAQDVADEVAIAIDQAQRDPYPDPSALAEEV